MFDKEKFVEIFCDENNKSELFKKISPEEVKEFFNAKGLECSTEEISKMGNYLFSIFNNNNEKELSEEELSEAAGGFVGEDMLLPNEQLVKIQNFTKSLSDAWDTVVDIFKSW